MGFRSRKWTNYWRWIHKLGRGEPNNDTISDKPDGEYALYINYKYGFGLVGYDPNGEWFDGDFNIGGSSGSMPYLVEYEASGVSENSVGVSENSVIGASVGITAFAEDLDVWDTVSYTLSDNAGGLFEIAMDQWYCHIGRSIDYEGETSHEVTVLASEHGWQYIAG